MAEPRTRIRAGEVHLWTACLDVTHDDASAFAGTLSADERARAERFRFPRDASRFVAGRGILRALLAAYLGRAPHELPFEYGPYGRPALVGDEVAFNVAHTGPTALYAFAAAEPLGVDIEESGEGALADRVPEHFFSAREVEALYALPAAEQEQAFLRCWTRKEAYLKAQGTGLALPLDGFAVTLGPSERPALTWTAWSDDEPRRWRLHDVSAHCPGCVAALAVAAEVDEIVLRRWPEQTGPPEAAGTTEKERR